MPHSHAELVGLGHLGPHDLMAILLLKLDPDIHLPPLHYLLV